MLTAILQRQLALILGQMSAEAGALFRAAFEKSVQANGHGAFKDGFKAVRAAFKWTAEGWSKRDSGDGDGDGDEDDSPIYACPNCRTQQAKHECMKCGSEGPPNYCSRCSSSMTGYSQDCPDCGNRYKSVPSENFAGRSESFGADVPVITAQFMETRVDPKDPDVGYVRCWGGANILDSHKTRIPVSKILDLITPEETAIDCEHDERAREGVTISEKALAAKPVPDPGKGGKVQPTEGASFELRCDLKKRGGKEVHQGFLDGTFTGLSIGFYPDAKSKAEVAAGKTDVLLPRKIPFLSCVRRPSNTAATLLEVRCERIMDLQERGEAQPAASVKSTTLLDTVKSFREEAAASLKPSGSPSAEQTAASASSPKADGPSEIDRIAALTTRVDAQAAQIAELVTALSSHKELEARAAELDQTVKELRASLDEQSQASAEIMAICKEFIKDNRAYIDQRIAALKAVDTRIGVTPSPESRAIEDLEKQEAKTREAKQKERERQQSRGVSRMTARTV